MNDDRHQELRLLVQADIDGELDARDAAAIAAHLDGCAECRALQAQLRRIKETTRTEATRFAASDDFRRRMAVLAQSNVTRPAATRRRLQWGGWIGSFGLGAAVAAALMLAIHVPRDGGDAQSVLDGHLRALQSGHAIDVASTDKHTVKPWFDGRLDFTPPVKDLAAAGFPLRGGRIDAVDGRPTAALVYGHGRHAIDLYVWPTVAGDAAARDTARKGYHFVTWVRDGMRFWAVSDLNPAELDEFARDWQAAD
ncbi:MAG TPA: zf-HC2 domain-containing protein [Stellaceae bacterium]